MTDNCTILLALSATKDGGDDSVPPLRFRRAADRRAFDRAYVRADVCIRALAYVRVCAHARAHGHQEHGYLAQGRH